jgi:hypothetical protein
MTTTPTRSIGTTFTISGIQSAIAGLRRLATSFRDRMTEMRLAAARAFAPILAGLKKISEYTFQKLVGAAKLAFKSIAVAAGLVALKITAISTAAYESSKAIAEMLNTISKDSKRLGIGAQDLGVLRFGFERSGVDPDETLQTLSDIGNEFKGIRDQILAADQAFQKTKAWNLQKAVAGGTAGSVFAAYNADNAAASSSFAGIQQRQDQIRSMIEQSRDRPGDGDDRLRLQLVEEFKQLETAKAQLQNSFGPQGQALFTLQKYSLDLEKATKGGVEGLYALSDAFRRVDDPATRLRISMQLFGEDAGAKMVTVLASGREGMEQYRKEMERLGGTVTEADAQLGSDYQASTQRLHTAIMGVRLEIARQLLPLIMESQAQLTEWLADHRTTIAELVKRAFVDLRNFVTDIIGFINGQRGDFKTPWLNTLMLKIQEAKKLLIEFQSQIQLLQSGQQSDWPWLNLVYAQLMRVWDGLKVVMGFASDAFAVLTGGSAQTYEWMNKVRDAVVSFGEKLQAAWSMFAAVIKPVHNALNAVLGLFHTDLTTMLLFLGIVRISSMLSGLVGILGTVRSAGAWLWGAGARVVGAFAGGAASAAGAAASAGAAGAAASSATGAIGLLRTALLAIPMTATTAMLGLGVAIAAGFAYAIKQQESFGDMMIAKQAEIARLQAEPQLRAREAFLLRNRLATDPAFRSAYRDELYPDTDNRTYQTSSPDLGHLRDAMFQARQPVQQDTFNLQRALDSQQKAAAAATEALKPQKTIDINLTYNGQRAKMTGDESSQKLWEQIQRDQRMGG